MSLRVIWWPNWKRGEQLRIASLAGHEGLIPALAFSPDGKILASGGDDRAVRLWSVARRQALTTLRGHAGQVSGLLFNPNGEMLASISEAQREIRIWNARRNAEE